MMQKEIEEWLKGNYDEETKAEIRRLEKADPEALADQFDGSLSFGTGGMRGIMQVGTNRINAYTIRMATQGVANYLLANFPDGEIRVVIGFDCRDNSELYAMCAARVLAGNNIAVFLTKDLRPSPLISFACRELKCNAGIMITASHNPPEYNGYKVYWNDGAQVLPPHDVGIIAEVEKISSIKQVKSSDPSNPLITQVAEELDERYFATIGGLQNIPDQNKEHGKELSVVYTSLHGTGITLMEKALKTWGFSNVQLVEKQCIPDGSFPTVKAPNPELAETLELGSKQMIDTNADLLIATDPDADRIGAVISHKGKSVPLDGNEIAALLASHLCETLSEQKRLPKNSAIVSTIVTTELIKEIANSYEVDHFEVLTGFKYIGEKIREWEIDPEGYHFLFGAEESYGYLAGTYARDKDAIGTACLLCEKALKAKRAGKTLIDRIDEIYMKYGYFFERQRSIEFAPGKKGMNEMGIMMQKLRASPPATLLGEQVISIIDFKEDTYLSLPKSNVLLFRTFEGTKIIVRPSGTEPKLKIYGAVSQKEVKDLSLTRKECDQKMKQLLDEVSGLLK